MTAVLILLRSIIKLLIAVTIWLGEQTHSQRNAIIDGAVMFASSWNFSSVLSLTEAAAFIVAWASPLILDSYYKSTFATWYWVMTFISENYHAQWASILQVIFCWQLKMIKSKTYYKPVYSQWLLIQQLYTELPADQFLPCNLYIKKQTLRKKQGWTRP